MHYIVVSALLCTWGGGGLIKQAAYSKLSYSNRAVR